MTSSNAMYVITGVTIFISVLVNLIRRRRDDAMAIAIERQQRRQRKWRL